MAEKNTIIKEKLKFSGFLNFRDYYSFAHDWWSEEEFDIVEEKYEEKINGDKKDIEIVWDASVKLTDYFKANCKIKIRAIGLTDVEVEVDGKKKKMNKLISLDVETKGVLVKDYSNKWTKSGTSTFFRDLYDKFIIPKRTSEMGGKVANFVKDFKEETKAFLELTGKK